jgi:CBS domain-containing protein
VKTAAQSTSVPGSFRSPSYEHATAGKTMRAGVIFCPPETPLRQVARMMATEHIHCVVVIDEGRWGVVSDLDLLRGAAADLKTLTAGDFAVSDLPTVTTDDRLERAMQMMVEHEVAHLLVLEPTSERAAGVLSTLDVAGVLAWGEA